MKRQVIITLALIGSLSIILSSFHVSQLITMFLLAGIVPGTDIVISPDQMFAGIALIAGFTLSALLMPKFRHLLGIKRQNTLRP